MFSGTLLPSSLSSSLPKGELKLADIDIKQLNLKEITAISEGGFSTELAAELSIMTLDFPIQNLPMDTSGGIKLPPELAERLHEILSNPVISQQLRLDTSQLEQLKTQLRDAIQPGVEQRFSPEVLKSLQQDFTQMDVKSKSLALFGIEQKQIKEMVTEFNNVLDGQKIRPQQELIAVPKMDRLIINTQLQMDGQVKSDLSALNSLALNQQVSNTPSTHIKPYMPTVAVDTQLARPQWQEAFNSRVVMLAQDHRQVAHIQINPPELGPVEIRLNMNAEQTHIQFVSQHSVVREAIEDAFPKLRDMMNQSGVNLGDVNVSDQKTSQESAEDNALADSSASLNTHESDNPDENTTVPARVQVQVGLVDQYI